MQRWEIEPLLEELESKNAINLDKGSLGAKTVQFISLTNYEKIKQLNREYFKDRPLKKQHPLEYNEEDMPLEEIKTDPVLKFPPYYMHKPPNPMENPPKFHVIAPPPTTKMAGMSQLVSKSLHTPSRYRSA